MRVLIDSQLFSLLHPGDLVVPLGKMLLWMQTQAHIKVTEIVVDKNLFRAMGQIPPGSPEGKILRESRISFLRFAHLHPPFAKLNGGSPMPVVDLNLFKTLPDALTTCDAVFTTSHNGMMGNLHLTSHRLGIPTVVLNVNTIKGRSNGDPFTVFYDQSGKRNAMVNEIKPLPHTHLEKLKHGNPDG